MIHMGFDKSSSVWQEAINPRVAVIPNLNYDF